jgi:hypothetical protein
MDGSARRRKESRNFLLIYSYGIIQQSNYNLLNSKLRKKSNEEFVACFMSELMEE